MTGEEKYRAIAACDAACDGLFYYGVVTTGIYCRPSCPSRTPKRENLRFFASREEAEAAGFRPCKRCRPGGGPGLQPQSTADPDPLPPGGGPGRTPGGLRRRPRPEGAPPFAGGPHSRIAPPYKKDPCAHGPFLCLPPVTQPLKPPPVQLKEQHQHPIGEEERQELPAGFHLSGDEQPSHLVNPAGRY